jgi:hypothetical protein
MATPKKTSRKPNAAFMKPVQPDDKLAAVVGSSPLPRTELTKKLLAFARKGKYRSIEIDLNQAVRETASFLKRTIDKKVDSQVFPARRRWSTR